MNRKIINLFFIILFWLTLLIVSILTLFFTLIQLNRIQRFLRKGKRFSVLYLEVMPKENAGYRYRSGKWKDILNHNGISARILNVFEKENFAKLTSTPALVHIFYLFFCWERFIQCFATLRYDVVIVRREVLWFNDYGNMFMEFFLRSINKKLILDFDDDISAAKQEPRPITFYGKLLGEVSDKFNRTLKFYNYFNPGSNYLKNKIIEQLPQFKEENIMVLPTLVDYHHFEIKKYDAAKEKISFGWIGSAYNYKYLPVVFDALNKLSQKYAIDFVLIGGNTYNYLTDFKLRQYKWSLKNEIELLKQIDVGVMPLFDKPEEKGKCGFKLIQYMGCGIVSVASAVTVNKDIIDDKVNGFLVYDESKWLQVLEEVINLKDQFSEIGKRAFEKIRDNYSFDVYTEKFIEFIKFVNQADK